jgi:isoprenylcysteine carboxyl methyltransferase (ICMT) family protein YpbQ
MPTRTSGWGGLLAILFWVCLIPKGDGMASLGWLLLLVCLGTIPLELLALRKTGQGMFSKPLRKASPKRVLLKYVGGIATLAGMALAYWLFPEYRGEFYAPYYQALYVGVPLYVVVGMFSLWFFDSRLSNPQDIYYKIGRALIFREQMSPKLLIQHTLQWLVKAFFLPLMFVYLVGHADISLHFQGTFLSWYDNLYRLCYLIDVAFVVVGYYTASRLFDSHIRSADPYAGGWVSALICYQPFWSLVSAGYIMYYFSPTWGVWLADSPVIHALWGTAILASLVVYVWATICFGSRFSNLTHRGIINFGPYAYCKHPAYVAKLISFLLIQVPWAAESPNNAIRGMALWGVLAFVYFCRAKTEERHLRLVDGTYAVYEQQLKQRWSRKG